MKELRKKKTAAARKGSTTGPDISAIQRIDHAAPSHYVINLAPAKKSVGDFAVGAKGEQLRAAPAPMVGAKPPRWSLARQAFGVRPRTSITLSIGFAVALVSSTTLFSAFEAHVINVTATIEQQPSFCDAHSPGFWKNHDGCTQGQGSSIWTSQINSLSGGEFAGVFATSTGSQICAMLWQPNCPAGNTNAGRLCRARLHTLSDELDVVSKHLDLDAFIAGTDDGESAFDHLGLSPFSKIRDALAAIEAILANPSATTQQLNNARYVASRLHEFYEFENQIWPSCIFTEDQVNACLNGRSDEAKPTIQSEENDETFNEEDDVSSPLITPREKDENAAASPHSPAEAIQNLELPPIPDLPSLPNITDIPSPDISPEARVHEPENNTGDGGSPSTNEAASTLNSPLGGDTQSETPATEAGDANSNSPAPGSAEGETNQNGTTQSSQSPTDQSQSTAQPEINSESNAAANNQQSTPAESGNENQPAASSVDSIPPSVADTPPPSPPPPPESPQPPSEPAPQPSGE